MKLKDYIQGKRHGKAANKLERQATDDPFLQDALDGFDTVEGEHFIAIQELEKQLESKFKKQRKFYPYTWRMVGMAASITLLIGIGSWLYFHLDNNNPPALAVDSTSKNIQEKIDTAPQSEVSQVEDIKPTSITAYAPPPTPTMEQRTEADCVQTEVIEEMEMSAKCDEVSSVAMADKVVAETAASKDFLLKETQTHNKFILSKSESSAKKSVEKPTERSIEMVVAESQAIQIEVFEEKEFKLFFEKNYSKGICSGEKASIKVHFDIDAPGTPINIKVDKCSCLELQKELLKLLGESPKWTSRERKVKLEIKLK